MKLKLTNWLRDHKIAQVTGEAFYVIAISALLAFLGLGIFSLGLVDFEDNDIFSFTYSANMTLEFSKSLAILSIIASLVECILLYILTAIFTPSGNKALAGKRGKNFFLLAILSLFGLLASVVLSLLLFAFGLSQEMSIVLSLFVCGIYFYLIYKLYLEEKTYSNSIIWEIFRFAIVGLVAAVFDFAVSYIVQFIALADNTAMYVTIVATACGFIIGVIINYLMSTFMVYKASKSNTSKTAKGIILFLALAVVGLFIGIGIQYLLYDYLFLVVGITFFSYPIDFVIRTLVVMVYNYITRKLFIYK